MGKENQTEKEKQIVQIRLEEIKYIEKASLVVWTKIFWFSGIFSLGILGFAIGYVTQNKINFIQFIFYFFGVIFLSIGAFAIVMLIFSGNIQRNVDKSKQLRENLIKDIKEGKLLK